MITFNQLLFLILIVLVVGPIVWMSMSALMQVTLRFMLRRHLVEPSAVTWHALRGFVKTARPGLDESYARLQALHDLAEAFELELSSSDANDDVRLFFRELHYALCEKLKDKPLVDAAVILRETNQLNNGDLPPPPGGLA